MYYIHLTDDLKQGFNFCEVGLLRSYADRSQLILHPLQVFVLVDHEQSIESWSLKEDNLALLQVFVMFL